MNAKRMLEQLILHEGFRGEPYQDTADPPNWTIGIGYNLSARGTEHLTAVLNRKFNNEINLAEIRLTEAEARLVCMADIQRIESVVRTHFPEYLELDEVRQRVCLDLAFNIGFHALDFRRCIDAIKTRNWSKAAIELHKSKWSSQVGSGRSDRLAQMLLTGNDWTV